jgi:hypothetical protein
MYFPHSRISILLLLACFIGSIQAHAELPNYIRNYLIQYVDAKQVDFKLIDSGRSFVKAMDTERREEIALIGVVKMKASAEFYVSKYRNIVEFESGPGIRQSGLFSSPPQISDVASLTWEHDDLEKLRKCKRNDCGVRLPQGSVLEVRSAVRWSSKNAHDQADALLRQKIVSLVKAYKNKGNRALPVYLDKGDPIRVSDGINTLLRNSKFLNDYLPNVISYVRNYPFEKNANAEDLFYWQKGEFGLQPVIRVSHVTIFELDNTADFQYAIASKMLYANHYFRDALEVRLLVSDSCAGCGFYLIAINRSHADGMTGFKGLFVRPKTIKKSVSALEEWLTRTKVRIEKAFGKP